MSTTKYKKLGLESSVSAAQVQLQLEVHRLAATTCHIENSRAMKLFRKARIEESSEGLILKPWDFWGQSSDTHPLSIEAKMVFVFQGIHQHLLDGRVLDEGLGAGLDLGSLLKQP